MAFEDQSAYTILRDFFQKMGVQFDAQVEGVIKDAMLQGYGPDQIDLIMPELEQTGAFKKRFPGFAKRVQNGYNALSLGDYLQLENQYHRILQGAGMPAGFYDDPSDFANWIANDVSPDEIQTRVQAATTAAQQIDPTMRNLMAKFYGLSTGDVAAYFLDQKRALPVIERQFNAAQIATAASRSGIKVNNMRHYEDLMDRGLTAQQAAAGYGTVRELRDTVGELGNIYGIRYNTRDAEEDVFFNKSERRQDILNREKATFSGQSRGSTGSAQRQSY